MYFFMGCSIRGIHNVIFWRRGKSKEKQKFFPFRLCIVTVFLLVGFLFDDFPRGVKKGNILYIKYIFIRPGSRFVFFNRCVRVSR